MPFDKKTFITRTLSAILFVLVMLTCILYNQWTFFFLFLVVQFIALKEFAFLLEEIYKIRFKRLSIFSLAIAGSSLYVFLSLLPLKECTRTYSLLSMPYLFYFLGLFGGMVLYLLFFSKEQKAKWLLMGLGYISIPLALLYQVRLQSLWIPLFLIAAIWINDTMAYIGGSFFGKNPLAKKISPNKTIEGTVIGILFAVGFGIAWHFLVPSYHLKDYVILALIASVIGTAGDLIESQLKRWAGVKDSGQLMPGHGGVLDRFDSLLFASSFAFVYAFFFMDCLNNFSLFD